MHGVYVKKRDEVSLLLVVRLRISDVL